MKIERMIKMRAQKVREFSESEACYRAIVDTAADGIVVIDERGTIQRFNPAAERMFGYAKAEVTGKNISLLMPSPHREDHDGYLARYLVTGEKRVMGIGREVTAQRKDGSTFPIYLSVAEMQVDGRHMFTGIFRDNTQAKLDIERQAQRIARLEAANMELESFSYSVSHDLRAPLLVIDGFSRIVEEDYAVKLDAEGRRLLGVIRANIQKMAELIDDLLEYSLLGAKSLASAEIDMKSLFVDALDGLRASGGRLDGVVLHPLPPARGDATLVKQALTNLLANAIKFCGKREHPTIEVSGRESGAQCVYCVKDNGAGFDMKYYDKLFGVFQRLHRADEFEGTGVGLAIVQRIVHRHGGRTWAEAEVNRGATFHFALQGENKQ
jgi:two-component system sensor kinase FixL